MRIAPISNTQNNKQSFKAHVHIEENADVVFNRYGLEFKEFFKALLKPLRQSKLKGCVSVEALVNTTIGTMFDIESNIPRGKKCICKHEHVPVLIDLGPLEKALKLASGVFKPFIRAGKAAK